MAVPPLAPEDPDLYSVFMQIPVPITVRRGEALVCVFQNAASLAIEDLRGTALPETRPEIGNEVLATMREVARTGRAQTLRAVPIQHRPDLVLRYWDITCAPVRLADGRVDGLITMAFDSTEGKLAEAERERVQSRLHAALAASTIGTYSWDLRTDQVQHDDTVQQLFGLPGDDVPVDAYTARIHEDDRAAWLAGLGRARDGADFHMEYRVVLPGGTLRWLLDKGRVVAGADGKPAHMVGAVVDISEQKRLAEQALAASRAKDEFLAVLGHELRNPLAPIVTGVQLLKLRGEPTREVEIIDRQVQHLIRLVDDLLDISRVTRGLIELKSVRLALGEVVARAIEMASPLMEQKQHNFTVDVPRALFIDGDPVRLAQVIANLLTNAARYTPSGGLIEVTAGAVGGRVRLRVRDSGSGIEPDMLDRVFELFVRGRSTTARDGRDSGLGIGLALARSLVTMHGGSITAESAGPGQGSVFTVELPAATAAEVAGAGDGLAAATSEQARRVLLVDDNVEAAELLADALRALGHDVAIAHDAPQALSVAADFRPEVAVLDIGLPVMDGHELARRLQENGNQACRYIALTGFGQDHDVARSREVGFHAHLVKPVALEKLTRTILGD